MSKQLYKVLSKQGSIGKVDKEAPERYEVIVKQFKRRAVTGRGNNINKPRKFSGYIIIISNAVRIGGDKAQEQLRRKNTEVTLRWKL